MPRAVRFHDRSLEADRQRPTRRGVLRRLSRIALHQGDIDRPAAPPVRDGRLEIAAPIAGCCERSLAIAVIAASREESASKACPLRRSRRLSG
jgi:hypothetical protein